MQSTTTRNPLGGPLPPLAESSSALARIEARLARIEAALVPLATLAESAPALAGIAGDALDEWAGQVGNDAVDARTRELGALLMRVSRPETLRNLNRALDLFDALPDQAAIFGDMFDEVMAGVAARGIDVEALLRSVLELGAHVSTRVQKRSFVDAVVKGALTEGVLDAMNAVGEALSDARGEDGSAGLFALMRALRDPDVQRTTAFAITFARRFGASLSETRQLTAG